MILVKPGTPIFTVVRDEQDQDMYDLKCEVKGGKPKPQVMFTRDGIELKVPGGKISMILFVWKLRAYKNA